VDWPAPGTPETLDESHSKRLLRHAALLDHVANAELSPRREGDRNERLEKPSCTHRNAVRGQQPMPKAAKEPLTFKQKVDVTESGRDTGFGETRDGRWEETGGDFLTAGS
jgi:hypothetical protein